jgi:hypothetical protein
VTFEKSGNQLKLNIFSDQQRTNHINGSPISMVKDFSGKNFNHFYAVNSHISQPPDNPEWTSGWIDNITLKTITKTENLQAYYPFNGNANDESGNENHGTVSGATLTSDRFGTENSAYYFDGIDDHILVPHNSELNFNNQGDELSVFVWIKTSDRGIIINKNPATSWYDPGYRLAVSDGKVDFMLEDSSKDKHWYGPVINDNEWHFIGVTIDSNNDIAKLYIDGEFYSEFDISSVSGTGNNSPLSIGYRADKSYFKGYIDDARIFNYILSESEIKKLFNENGWEGNTSAKTKFSLIFSPAYDSDYSDQYLDYHQPLDHFVTRLNIKSLEEDVQNVTVSATLEGHPLRLSTIWNNEKINAERVTVDINTTGFEFLIYSDSAFNEINNGKLSVFIQTANGTSYDTIYNDLVSMYFAKNKIENYRAFLWEKDSYGFKNFFMGFWEIISLMGPIDLLDRGGIGIIIEAFSGIDGLCHGFAASSGAFGEYQFAKSPLSGYPFEWKESTEEIKKKLATFQVSQILEMYSKSEFNSSLQQSYIELKNQLSLNKPVVFGLPRHSVLATKITEFTSQKKSFITIYDSNKIEYFREATYETQTNIFSYKLYDINDVYRTVNEFYIFPQDIYNYNYSIEVIMKTWAKRLSDLGKKAYVAIFRRGETKSMISDANFNFIVQNSEGLKVGYEKNGELFNQIDGSEVIKYPAYSDSKDSLIFIYVPSGDVYSTEVTTNQSGYVRLEYFNPSDKNQYELTYADSIPINPYSMLLFNDTLTSKIGIDITGDGIADFTKETTESPVTSIKAVKESKKFLLYPNPTNNILKVEFEINAGFPTQIEILSLDGRMVKSMHDLDSNSFEIDISDLSPGIYFINAKFDESRITKKFVKN